MRTGRRSRLLPGAAVCVELARCPRVRTAFLLGRLLPLRPTDIRAGKRDRQNCPMGGWGCQWPCDRRACWAGWGPTMCPEVPEALWPPATPRLNKQVGDERPCFYSSFGTAGRAPVPSVSPRGSDWGFIQRRGGALVTRTLGTTVWFCRLAYGNSGFVRRHAASRGSGRASCTKRREVTSVPCVRSQGAVMQAGTPAVRVTPQQ